VQRAVLCQCAGTGLSKPPPTPSRDAAPSAPPAGRLTLLASGAGASMVTDALLAAAAEGRPLPGHTQQCSMVLVKSAPADARSDSELRRARLYRAERLRFEAALQDRLATAACRTTPADAPAAANVSEPDWPTTERLSHSVRPHVRLHPQPALLLPDGLGQLLAECVPRAPPTVCASNSPVSPLQTTSAVFSPSSSRGRPVAQLSPQLIGAALRATLAVAAELRVLHSCGLVHKALHPSSILLHPPSGRVQFLDLSEATVLIKDKAEAGSSSSALAPVQFLLYASPELSGKVNRVIDARSDLYALGCIFYELLMGRPPFVSDDALELVHMHLARAPPSILPRQPPPAPQPLLWPLLKATQSVLSRLLQKEADDRCPRRQSMCRCLRRP